MLADLNPAATKAEFERLQARLGAALPADFIACLGIHDGQKGEAGWLFEEWEFLSARRIAEEWSIWRQLHDAGDFDGNRAEGDPGVKALWWSRRWIPFASNGFGDHLCLDLDPDQGGEAGQIITVWHDSDRREKAAESFREWFAAFVASQG